METAKQFSDARYISLETFRKSGIGVRTTVWLVEDDGVLYFRTDPKSGKAKRIRLNPHVRVARSDIRGNVKGVWVDGEAQQVDERESVGSETYSGRSTGCRLGSSAGSPCFQGGVGTTRSWLSFV